jgi:hypothetical protein
MQFGQLEQREFITLLIASKWLETLKQVAPEVRRAAVLHHPNIAANTASCAPQSPLRPRLQ